jgi:hypothetical protein
LSEAAASPHLGAGRVKAISSLVFMHQASANGGPSFRDAAEVLRTRAAVSRPGGIKWTRMILPPLARNGGPTWATSWRSAHEGAGKLRAGILRRDCGRLGRTALAHNAPKPAPRSAMRSTMPPRTALWLTMSFVAAPIVIGQGLEPTGIPVRRSSEF